MRPLHLLDNVQTAVYDELVHMPGIWREPGQSIAALFGGAKLVFEERIVLSPDYSEIIRHLRGLSLCRGRVVLGEVLVSRR